MTTTQNTIDPRDYPGIHFSEQGARRLEEVSEFLDKLDKESSEHAGEIRQAFLDKLQYLNTYGGDPEDAEKRFFVELHPDWAPLSFSIVWKDEGGVYAFNGGLIWHGGSNDPLTVTLTPQWWGVHT